MLLQTGMGVITVNWKICKRGNFSFMRNLTLKKYNEWLKVHAKMHSGLLQESAVFEQIAERE